MYLKMQLEREGRSARKVLENYTWLGVEKDNILSNFILNIHLLNTLLTYFLNKNTVSLKPKISIGDFEHH
jgi:hypothetical protein